MVDVIVPPDFEEKTRAAVRHYWSTLGVQASRPGPETDRGNRRAVTSGKQLDGFSELVRWLVAENGMPEASIHVRGGLELPGYFRPSKKWDLIVVHRRQLVAAIEFKSQAGPSFGNNFNNRTEESLGNATDLWTAFREGAFGTHQLRPWVGWMMLVEDCEGSRVPVGLAEPHFKVFDEFRETSYAGRYELLLRKLIREKLYDGAAMVLSSRDASRTGDFFEPAADLTVRRFLAGLGGYVRTVIESV